MAIEAATDEQIKEALEKLVADGISAGAFVVLDADQSRNYYIQFAFQDGRLYCEAVSNQYLEPGDQLNDGQLAALENLGWREPEHEAQNWFRVFRPDSPTDFAEIVQLVHRVFHEIYGIAVGAAITLTRSWEDQQLAPATSVSFASENHRESYDQVVSHTLALFGDEGVKLDPRRPLIFVQQGSAITTVAINPVGDWSSIVDIYSVIVRGAEPTAELMRWLLERNSRMRMGGFCLAGDDEIILKHSLIGDELTGEELVLKTIVESADELDGQITDQFGGSTARDTTHR
jgi:hypothetical protein